MTATLPEPDAIDDDDHDPANPASERSDLGFGRVVLQQARGRFLGRDGVPTSRKYGLGGQYAAKFYLHALNATWAAFIGWMFGVLLLLNGIFALAYVALGEGALHGAEQMGLADPFMRALSFSVGVFTTTGTGTIYAVGTTANWLQILESFVGPITLVTCTGMLIARLTRPRMTIRFSESAVIAPYEGGRGLMFRMVNTQPGELNDVHVRVNLAWFEEINGVRERDFRQLKLERDSVDMFPLHWTVVHPIDEDSPLRGVTPERLAGAQAELLIHVSAHEETFSTQVVTRTSYVWNEVRWDVKFASIFATSADGVLAIDVDRLDRTERLPEGTTTLPAASEAVSSASGA